MPKQHVLTPSEQEHLELYKKMIDVVLKSDGYSVQSIAALANIEFQVIKGIRNGKAYISSLIRVMDALGYQVSFTKIKEAKRLSDNLDAVTRLMTLKTKRSQHNGKARTKRSAKRKTGAVQQHLREQQQRTGNAFAID